MDSASSRLVRDDRFEVVDAHVLGILVGVYAPRHHARRVDVLREVRGDRSRHLGVHVLPKAPRKQPKRDAPIPWRREAAGAQTLRWLRQSPEIR